jgi:hypothetical protein
MDCLLLNPVYDSALHFEFQAYCRVPFRYLLNYSLSVLISLFKEIIARTIQSACRFTSDVCLGVFWCCCWCLFSPASLPLLSPILSSRSMHVTVARSFFLLFSIDSHSFSPSPCVYLARTHMIALFDFLFFFTVSMHQPSRAVEIF